MSEELLDKIFTKLVSMESDIASIKSDMKTEISSIKTEMSSIKTEISSMKTELKEDIRDLKNEIRNLKEADQAILELCEKSYRLAESVEKEQTIQKIAIRNLSADCAHNAAEIEFIRRAKIKEII